MWQNHQHRLPRHLLDHAVVLVKNNSSIVKYWHVVVVYLLSSEVEIGDTHGHALLLSTHTLYNAIV